jgi:pimeloyl-ACP methyl ester carboxylesterase
MEQMRVAANGLRFNVLRAGAGRPLLMLHGWPEFARVWEKVMARLAGRFALIAPDLRDFGQSDKPDPGPSAAARLGIAKAGIVKAVVATLV